MTDSNEQLHTPDEDAESGRDDELPQPAQEIVDPREDEPRPEAPNVDISGPRDPERP